MDDKPEAHLIDKPAGSGWDTLARFLKHYRHIVWAVLTAIGLGIFLLLLPDYIRAALWRILQAQRFLAGLWIAFSLLSLSLVWSTGQSIDAWVFTYFNLRANPPRWLDWAMLAMTQIGNGGFALALAIVFFLVSDRRLAYETALGTLSLWLLVEVVKATVRRSRPFVKLTQARIVGYRESGRSFPSGHTSQSFFLATLLVQHYQLGLGGALLLYGVAGFVALTRVYVGAHYPRDVLAGALLGVSWGLLGGLIDARFFVAGG